jgi:hypothetical protein
MNRKIRGIKMLKIRPAETKDAKDLATINVLGWKTTYYGLVPDELLNVLSVTEKRIENFKNQILDTFFVKIQDVSLELISLFSC